MSSLFVDVYVKVRREMPTRNTIKNHQYLRYSGYNKNSFTITKHFDRRLSKIKSTIYVFKVHSIVREAVRGKYYIDIASM